MDEHQLRYLKGEQFTDTLIVPTSRHASMGNVHRLEYLRQLVAGKRVIHVGCVDHLPLLEDRRKNGQWLHEILLSSASHCVGIDINGEGCRYLSKSGIPDVYECDIIEQELPGAIAEGSFDFVILGEMIEHVDNPVAFLTAVRKKFEGVAQTLITTTPNAFRIQNIIDTLRGRESINSDHRYWFTPYTLAKIMVRAGFDEVGIETIWYSPLKGKKGLLKRVVTALLPSSKDCLIASANVHPPAPTF